MTLKDKYIHLLKHTICDILLEKDPAILRGTNEGRINCPSRALTMIGFKRLTNIEKCVESIMGEGIEGDFIETGVWRGGACIFMRGLLCAYNDEKRKVYVADSFQGLPPPDAKKYPADFGDAHYKEDYLRVSLETVQENFSKFNLLDDQVVFKKGFFKDTIQDGGGIDKLALLRLDGDMYESTIQVLEGLYDKLSIGGYIIIDDFALSGAKKAVEDFRAMRNINEPIQTIDFTGVFWKKMK